jgi:thiamine-phosphate pyrophosphorylase
LSRALKKPVVCYVTDRKGFGSGDQVALLREKIGMAIAAGVDWVQIREKDLLARALLVIVREAVAAVARARVIVNDRFDIALACGAGGVQLGRESAPAREVAAWCRGGNAPDGFSIGVSCHSTAEARAAESAGASHVIFGPVFDTPSKRAFGQAQGIVKLAEVCGGVRIPVIAIGGVNVQNGAECVAAGAAGIAAIRLFQEAPDLSALKASLERLHPCE